MLLKLFSLVPVMLYKIIASTVRFASEKIYKYVGGVQGCQVYPCIQ